MPSVTLCYVERASIPFPFNFAMKGSIEAIFDAQSWNQANVPGKLLGNTDPVWGFHNSTSENEIWLKVGRDDIFLFEDAEGIYAWGRVKDKFFEGPATGTEWTKFVLFKRLDPISPPVSSLQVRRVLALPLQGQTASRELSEVGIHTAEFFELLLRDSERNKSRSLITPEVDNQESSPVMAPYLGQTFKNREHIWRTFGGQKIWGINRFAIDDIVNVFSDEDGPYPDYENPESGVIEYRGQGLSGDQSLSLGNKYLEEARLTKKAVRYWRKPSRGSWRFEKWVIVVDYEFIDELDVNGVPAKRILWYLEPVSSPIPEHWSPIQQSRIPESKSSDDVEENFSQVEFLQRYQLLSARAEDGLGLSRRTSATLRSSYRRSRALRELVLERALMMCENDQCTGMPPDRKANGDAILEVDHIDPLSQNGADHPSNMVSLCPIVTQPKPSVPQKSR